MTRIPSHRDGLGKSDEEFLHDIEKYGWNVTTVLKRPGEQGPDWSFSCVLYFTFRHPEIVIFGLSAEKMHSMINQIGKQIRDGARFEA